MDGNIKLRKLAHKSTLDGIVYKYGKSTVEQLLNGHHSTLIHVYYYHEKISFIPEIIQQLKDLYPNFKEIDKPGINQELFLEVVGEKVNVKVGWDQYTSKELEKIIKEKTNSEEYVSSNLLHHYRKAKVGEKFDKSEFNLVKSKTKLQSTNHGR